MNQEKKNKQLNDIHLLLIIYMAIVMTIILASCNPVKQVIRDKRKLDEVAKVVLRSGYCANDTTIVSVSDTITQVDTITNIDTEILFRNDTVILTKVKHNYVTKTIKIRDTIRQVVVDNARISILEKEKIDLVDQLADAKENNRKKLNWIVVLVLFILGYIYFKKRP